MLHVSVMTMLPVVHKYNCVGMLERCSSFLMDGNHTFSTLESADNFVLKRVYCSANVRMRCSNDALQYMDDTASPQEFHARY